MKKKCKGRRKMENGKNGKFPVGAVVTGEGDDEGDDDDDEDDENGKRAHRLS